MTPAELALTAAVSRLGRKEIAQNRGPIVEECCRPFCAPADFDRIYVNGKMRWCAGFVSLCWCAGWPGFLEFADLSCDKLWDKLTAAGFTRLRGGEMPQPGDIFWLRRKGTTRDLSHVGLVETTGRMIHTIEGNAPTSLGDTGSVGRHRHALDQPSIYGFATITPR